MPITKDEVSKEVNLNIPSGLSEEIADDIKKEVGEFLVESILNDVADAKSPVKGGKYQEKLSEEYAEKTGKKFANLDLEGDMLNALTFNVTKKGVEVGIFDSDQAIKAYNHNVGDTLPQRRFIPASNQTFLPDIMEGVKEIVSKRVSEAQQDNPEQTIRVEPRRAPVPEEDLPNRVVSSQSAFDKLIRGLLSGKG